MNEPVHYEYLKYAVDVAEALRPLARRAVSYGDLHIARVTFGFDGDEDTTICLVPSDVGGLGVLVES